MISKDLPFISKLAKKYSNFRKISAILKRKKINLTDLECKYLYDNIKELNNKELNNFNNIKELNNKEFIVKFLEIYKKHPGQFTIICEKINFSEINSDKVTPLECYEIYKRIIKKYT